MTMTEKCIYNPRSQTIIDLIRPDGTTAYGRCDAEQEAAESGAEIWAFDEAVRHRQDSFKRGPVLISADKFAEMLGVLPPLDWHIGVGGESESFKLQEFTAGTITAIYCRIGDQHWQMHDECSLTHTDIMARCQDAATNGNGQR